MLVELVEPVGQ